MIDTLRTLRVAATGVGPTLARLAMPGAPSTCTADGLAEVRRVFADMLARLGVRLEVIGVERLPATGGFVLMWNQESHLDHLVLAAAIPRPFFSLYNNAIARFPFYGEHLRASGHVHVDRHDEGQWRGAIAAAAGRVERGECVLVSPEGTRSWDGQLLPMKRGASILAIESRRPVVCVTVIGGHARLPRGSAVVRSGRLRVVLSEPIALGDVTEADEAKVGARVAATFEEAKRAYAL